MMLKDIRDMISARLKTAGIESCDYESWLILEWILSVSRTEYYLDPEREIPQAFLDDLEEILEKREKHVPLQYLMGNCEFMGYSFHVDERVLIPRQDTECLVEEVVRLIRESVRPDETDDRFRLLDLCTGSGCIGISIKLLCPHVDVVLSDLSRDALDMAAYNAGELGADVTLVQGDLYDALSGLPGQGGTFDLIVSNPPYIPTGVLESLMPEVRDHEPLMALDGRDDGLFYYRRIARGAPGFLKEGGNLFCEIGADQADAVGDLMRRNGFQDIRVRKDLAGLDRIISGRLS